LSVVARTISRIAGQEDEMANDGIDRRAIERHVKELNKAYQQAAKKYPVTVPVQGRGFTLSAGLVGGGIEQDPDLVRLLIWVDEQTGNLVNVGEFAAQTETPVDDVQVLARALERDGLVDDAGIMGGDFYRISEDGRVELRRLGQLRNDPAARHRYATDACLRWLYTTAHDQRPVDPTGFFAAAGSRFAGGELTATELHYALARLTHSGLVSDIDTEPKTVAITIDGIDCVLSGATVSDYLNRTRPGDYYSISGTNIVAGSQGKVEQNNHNNALDPSALREFAAVVAQFAPTLGAEPDQQEQLVRDAQALSEEADGAAEPGHIRAAYDRLMTGLRGITAASAGVVAVINQGEEAYRTFTGN
jgi:hypothetical protein